MLVQVQAAHHHRANGVRSRDLTHAIRQEITSRGNSMRPDPDFCDALRRRLAERWACPAPTGLTLETIRTVSAFFPHELPDVYQRFLMVCGRDAGELFLEYEWQTEHLQSMNERMLSYAEYSGVATPEFVFTFLDYIGDYFWCFRCGESDPQVLLFDHCEFADTGFRLSEFLLRWEQYE